MPSTSFSAELDSLARAVTSLEALVERLAPVAPPPLYILTSSAGTSAACYTHTSNVVTFSSSRMEELFWHASQSSEDMDEDEDVATPEGEAEFACQHAISNVDAVFALLAREKKGSSSWRAGAAQGQAAAAPAKQVHAPSCK